MESTENTIIPKYQLAIGGSKLSLDLITNTAGNRVPKAQLDMEDFTFNTNGRRPGDGILVFLTKVFKSGHLMGFWSHSPCSTTRDQEQGWAIIDSNTMTIVETFETKTMGQFVGGYRNWAISLKTRYGKANYIVNSLGERPWKMGNIND